MNWLIKWWRPRKSVTRERELAPHEKWPEILHYQEGDEFETRHWPYYRINLIALNDSGGAYCSVDHGHTRRLALRDLVGTNISLKDRQISEDLKTDTDYMELIKQFNVAFKELQERDKKNGIAAPAMTTTS